MLAIVIIRIRKESKTKDLRNDLPEDFINIMGKNHYNLTSLSHYRYD
jgi:hypothetical protein